MPEPSQILSYWLKDAAWVERFAGSAVVMSAMPVADHSAALNATELDSIGSAIDIRRHTYSSGRACARAALAGIGVVATDYPAGLLRQSDGSVSWPAGSTGSISHTNDWAVAAATCPNQSGIQSMGIDVERVKRLKSGVLRLIATEQERCDLEQDDNSGWETAALFSLKESLYKCLRPSYGAYIRFQDVEIAGISDIAYADAQSPTIYQPRMRFMLPALSELYDDRRLRIRAAVIEHWVLTLIAYRGAD